MKLCLDTCAYSKMHLQHEELITIIEQADAIYLPTIVYGEIIAGFCMRKLEQKNLAELKQFLALPGVEIIPISTAIADRYGRLIKKLREQGTPIPTNDIWIAATAFETGSRLVTYDTHFSAVPGLLILAP